MDKQADPSPIITAAGATMDAFDMDELIKKQRLSSETSNVYFSTSTGNDTTYSNAATI